MSQREEMQLLIALKRALEKDMGIEVDMGRFGVQQRLLRLARASEDPEVAEMAARLRGKSGESPAPANAGRRIRGYYRGRPIYDD
ncbi:MAG: hypothetical protein ACQER6_02630 [Pseudomonadota bacterium]